MAVSMAINESMQAANGRTVDTDPRSVRPWLRAEGAATFAAGLAGFLFLGLPWWAFAILLLVPDVSMVGYLRGPRVGAIVYNLVARPGDRYHRRRPGPGHRQRAAGGRGSGSRRPQRHGPMAGYGLKYPDAFQHTHLGGADPGSVAPSQS